MGPVQAVVGPWLALLACPRRPSRDRCRACLGPWLRLPQQPRHRV